jgi:hypothetical protein
MVICPCLLEDTLPLNSSGISSSDDFMSLNLDILSFDNDLLDISLSHYFLDDGCQIPDPDFKIRIFRTHCVAFPISYLDANIYIEISPSSPLDSINSHAPLTDDFFLEELIPHDDISSYISNAIAEATPEGIL